MFICDNKLIYNMFIVSFINQNKWLTKDLDAFD